MFNQPKWRKIKSGKVRRSFSRTSFSIPEDPVERRNFSSLNLFELCYCRRLMHVFKCSIFPCYIIPWMWILLCCVLEPYGVRSLHERLQANTESLFLWYTFRLVWRCAKCGPLFSVFYCELVYAWIEMRSRCSSRHKLCLLWWLAIETLVALCVSTFPVFCVWLAIQYFMHVYPLSLITEYTNDLRSFIDRM